MLIVYVLYFLLLGFEFAFISISDKVSVVVEADTASGAVISVVAVTDFVSTVVVFISPRRRRCYLQPWRAGWEAGGKVSGIG